MSFQCLGYNPARVIAVDATEWGWHGNDPDVAGCTHPNGAVLRSFEGLEYILESGGRRELTQSYVIDSWGIGPDLPPAPLQNGLDPTNSIPDGTKLGMRPGSLMRYQSKTHLTATAAGVDFGAAPKRYLSASQTDARTFLCYGWTNTAIIADVNSTIFGLHAAGAELPGC